MVRRRMLEIFVLKYEAQYEIKNKIKRDWSLRTKSSAFYLMSGCDYLLHYCYFQLPVFLVISFLVVRWWTDLSFRSCWRFNNTSCVCMSFQSKALLWDESTMNRPYLSEKVVVKSKKNLVDVFFRKWRMKGWPCEFLLDICTALFKLIFEALFVQDRSSVTIRNHHCVVDFLMVTNFIPVSFSQHSFFWRVVILVWDSICIRWCVILNNTVWTRLLCYAWRETGAKMHTSPEHWNPVYYSETR
jgi:hypothetical protein